MKKILFALVALLGFMACDSNEPTIEHTLSLIVDKSEIIANGEDEVTFAVKRLDTREYVENATIHFADTHEALEGMTFKTKYAGEYSFYAKCGSETSEVWTVVAKEPSNNDDPNDKPNDDPDNPVKKEYLLSVSPASIVADGQEKALFTLKADGEIVEEYDIYNAADDTQLTAKEFSTTEAGTYSFYAMCEGEKSNSVEVVATEVVVEQPKPITLTASKTTIKANGVDFAQLTVTEEVLQLSL